MGGFGLALCVRWGGSAGVELQAYLVGLSRGGGLKFRAAILSLTRPGASRTISVETESFK